MTKQPDLIKNMAENQIQELVDEYKKTAGQRLSKYKNLKDLDIFVLDNSIRESTVGQLRGHTLEAKWQVYDEVKKCGFKHTIVSSFNHMTRVDDVFVKQLVDRGEDRDGLWAFSEVTEHPVSVTEALSEQWIPSRFRGCAGSRGAILVALCFLVE